MPTATNQSWTKAPAPGLICMMIAASQQQQDVIDYCGIWHNHGMPDTSQYDADPVIRLSETYSVSMQDREEIVAYLRGNPDLIPVLQEAPDRIRESFPSSGLSIAMFTDPESELTELAVVIHYDGEPESTTERLLEFSRKWWGKVARPLAGRMMVCLE